jgi:protein-S-isoprenylcysteine O-methyltransferase Ste14
MSTLMRAIVLATGAVWVVFELRQSVNARPEATRADRTSTRVLVLAVAAGFVAANLTLRNVREAAIRPAAAAWWVGLALLWGGIALRLWSFRTLGRYFTFSIETSRDQPLITAGPYRIVRHPSYAALLVAFFGIGLLLGNWLALAFITIATLFGLVYRIGAEERALEAALGDRFREYAATRKRLVPYVW